MKTKKLFIVMVVTGIIMAAFFIGAFAKPAAAQTKTLKLGHIVNLGWPLGLDMKKFLDLDSDISRLSVTLFLIGFITSEILPFLQLLIKFINLSVLPYHMLLLITSSLMLIGFIIIWVKQSTTRSY